MNQVFLTMIVPELMVQLARDLAAAIDPVGGANMG